MLLRLITCFFLLFILACAHSDMGYSYTAKNGFLDANGRHNIEFENKFISYKGFLIEFNLNTRNPFDTTSTIRLDTLSVFLIDVRKKIYYEFNTFSYKAKIIAHDSIHKKKYGIQLKKDYESQNMSDFNSLKDTTINGIQFKKKTISIDKGTILNILFKSPKTFVSIYDYTVKNQFKDKYLVFGYEINNINGSKGFGFIEDLKKITKKEINICDFYLLKAGLK